MRPGPLAAAVALAVFLIVRRRRLEPTLLIGGALAVVALLVYASGLVHPPNVKKLVEDAGNSLGKWTYLLVAVMAFFETGAFVGLIAPGETFLIFGGVVAGQGTVSLFALIALVWAAAVAGDLASFYAGRRLGRTFLERHGPKVSITEERLRTVEAFFDRHGGKAIFLGRFVGLVRAVNPFLAGSSGMPLRRFLPYDVVGAGVWATMLLVLGYVFWRSFDRILTYAERGTLALGTTIVVVVALIWLIRHFRDEEHRRRAISWVDRQLDRPLLRPVGVVVRPVSRFLHAPLRFIWHRVTPGDLGLELTTLLAVAGVGTFAFVANAVALRDNVLVGGDSRALSLADDLRTGTLDDLARAVSHLGSPIVVGAATVVMVVVLLWRRRTIEACALGAGALLIWLAVDVAGALVDRSHPPGSLVDTSGDSYPAAHAAYAVAWAAIAVVLTRTVGGIARPAIVTIGAMVVVVAVATAEVYLRAQYLSDVVGGIGIGVAIFAGVGMVAIVVAHVRHNGVAA